MHSVGKGSGRIADAVKPTPKFQPSEALEPGTEYTIRLVTKNWVDNNSIFEDVIETRGRGETRSPSRCWTFVFPCGAMLRFHLVQCECPGLIVPCCGVEVGSHGSTSTSQVLG